MTATATGSGALVVRLLAIEKIGTAISGFSLRRSATVQQGQCHKGRLRRMHLSENLAVRLAGTNI